MVAHSEHTSAPVHERVDFSGLVEVAVRVRDQVRRAPQVAEQPELVEALQRTGGEEKVVESRGGGGFGSAVCLGKGETCVARVFRVSRVEGVLQR